jgi:hypothetical protein
MITGMAIEMKEIESCISLQNQSMASTAIRLDDIAFRTNPVVNEDLRAVDVYADLAFSQAV